MKQSQIKEGVTYLGRGPRMLPRTVIAMNQPHCGRTDGVTYRTSRCVTACTLPAMAQWAKEIKEPKA